MTDDTIAGGAEGRTAGERRPRKLRDDTIQILERFEALDGERSQGGSGWYRPADMHATGLAPRRIAERLTQLVRDGLLERQDINPAAWRDKRRWEYRITNAGSHRLAFDRPD